MADIQQMIANITGQGDAVKFANELSSDLYPGEGYLKRGDALRHMLWQAKLQQKYGSLPAALAGHVYELAGAMEGQEGNESDMDLHNNEIGRRIGKESTNDTDLVGKALQEIVEGRAKHYADGGSVDTAIDDYSQLLEAYPNAKKFLASLGKNVEAVIPTQSQISSPETALETALNFAPMGMAGAIKVSHGSPHGPFTEFDLEKMGTGAGAQMYGEGVYFGKGYNSPVAMKYVPRNEALENKLQSLYDAAEKRNQYPALEVYENYMLNKSPEEVEAIINESLPDYSKSEQMMMKSAHQAAKKAYQGQKGSYLYNADLKWIDPERELAEPMSPEHFLHWNKPLNEQSNYVLNALGDKAKGQYGYDILSNLGTQKEAANYLESIGIPGIKYFEPDYGTGNDVENFIAFNPKTADILSINSKEIAKKLRGNKQNIVEINGKPVKKAEGGRIDKDNLPLNKPRRTPNHPTKSHVVKTMVDGKEKIIRFGEQGAVTAGKPKEGESEAMKAKRASFKARHAKNIAKGPSSAAYWADKVKWADGGSVDIDHDHINSIIEAFNAEYGLRPDNTEKGRGYLNELKRPDGAVMTEFTIGVPIEGREMDIPTLVPTLTIDEIKSILSLPENGKIPRSIVQKAAEHAINRVKQGKSVFATPEESEFGEK